MDKRFIDFYMDIAERTAMLSRAVRLKVGAVLVKDDKMFIGYNGTPKGWDNTCEIVVDVDPTDPRYDVDNFTKELKTKPEVLHAETNAIAKLAKSTESGDGAVLFVTHSPCLDCAKLIFQSGICSVFYRDNYRNSDGIAFLEKSGLKVEKLDV